MIRQKVRLTIFLILLIGGGFLRDFFMLNVNHVLKHIQLGYPNYAYRFFSFMDDWTIQEIIVLKWILTIVFFFYFWWVSYVVLKTYFGKNRNVRPISYAFLTLFLLAGTLYFFGKIFDIEKSIYHIVRTLTGLTHSFMPAMVVFLYLKYFLQQNNDTLTREDQKH